MKTERANASREAIQEAITRFTERQQWMHNIPLPFGLFTIKPSSTTFSIFEQGEEFQARLEKLRVKGSKDGLVFDSVKPGATVLDVACGEGKYSIIASVRAAQVFGIDLDPLRIEKAAWLKECLGLENVDVRVMDVFSEEFKELPRFDIALCLGILHRVPDPFNFINAVAAKADRLLLEWRSPPGKLSHDEPWAYHRPGGLYEWHNAIGNYEDKADTLQTRAGGGQQRASYWYMSYRAVEALCERAGLRHFLRFSRAARYRDLSRDSKRLTARVMLLAGREPFALYGRSSQQHDPPERLP